jgi:hypothetical protein
MPGDTDAAHIAALESVIEGQSREIAELRVKVARLERAVVTVRTPSARRSA